MTESGKEPELVDQPMTQTESSGPPEPGSFAAGYHEGREDVLYALAAGHQWALDALEKHKAKVVKVGAMNALIDKERDKFDRHSSGSDRDEDAGR